MRKKLAICFTINSTFLANHAPTPHDWRGRVIIKKGRGGHFETPSFSVYFFLTVSKKIFHFFWQITTPRCKLSSRESRPPGPPPAQFCNIWTLPNFGLEQAKLQCQQSFVVLLDNNTWLKTYEYIEKCHKIFWTNQLPIFSRLWSTFSVSQECLHFGYQFLASTNFSTNANTSKLSRESLFPLPGYFLMAGNLEKKL